MKLFGSARRSAPVIETERLSLRLPATEDFEAWATLRRESAVFLRPWDPIRPRDELTARAFRRRVEWARAGAGRGQRYPFLLFRKSDGALIGGLTLDNIRRAAANSGALGYWIGAPHARQGYMSEAVGALRDHAFFVMELGRLEAACLPENAASRALLRRCGFVEEGLARSYLQIAGVWRDHVLHAALAPGRRDGDPAMTG